MAVIWRVCALLVLVAGCSQRRGSVVDAFPPAALATPWELRGEVWSGTFDEAAVGLGDEADDWRPFGPRHAWIARYCHDQRPSRCLTVRVFSFDSPAAAGQAYAAFQPEDASLFEAGDAGCWTEIGVLFRWGRLVADIFGPSGSMDDQLQSGLLAGFVVERMPPAVPADPR